MSKHTPGPWVATGRYIGTKNHKSFIGECRDVNGNWSDEAPASANARLIAAAPDMLAALENIAAKAELAASAMDEDERGRNVAMAFDLLAQLARAALSAATGTGEA